MGVQGQTTGHEVRLGAARACVPARRAHLHARVARMQAPPRPASLKRRARPLRGCAFAPRAPTPCARSPLLPHPGTWASRASTWVWTRTAPRRPRPFCLRSLASPWPTWSRWPRRSWPKLGLAHTTRGVTDVAAAWWRRAGGLLRGGAHAPTCCFEALRHRCKAMQAGVCGCGRGVGCTRSVLGVGTLVCACVDIRCFALASESGGEQDAHV